MMTLQKIGAGHGYGYLTTQTAAQDTEHVQRGGLADYYAERGEAPGSGSAPGWLGWTWRRARW